MALDKDSIKEAIFLANVGRLRVGARMSSKFDPTAMIQRLHDAADAAADKVVSALKAPKIEVALKGSKKKVR